MVTAIAYFQQYTGDALHGGDARLFSPCSTVVHPAICPRRISVYWNFGQCSFRTFIPSPTLWNKTSGKCMYCNTSLFLSYPPKKPLLSTLYSASSICLWFLCMGIKYILEFTHLGFIYMCSKWCLWKVITWLFLVIAKF